MAGSQCPLCQCREGTTCSGNFDYFNCVTCQGVYIDNRLVSAPTTLDNWSQLLSAARELRLDYDHPPSIRFDGVVTVPDENTVEHRMQVFPTSIRERAQKLLSAFIKRSAYFGDLLPVIPDRDFPLAYAVNAREFSHFVNYLEELGYVEKVGFDEMPTRSESSGIGKLRVTASGYEAHASAELLPNLAVFISSTCHDLKDCRAELTQHLESLGCDVLVSDDPSRFEVSATNDSIQSCLLNVKNSDVVLCILDQRYGPPLPDGEFKGISATHAEVRFARQMAKPVFFFIRQQAYDEWSLLKRDPATVTLWVEPHNIPRKKLWTEFVAEFIKLPSGEGSSNWFDQFSNIVDLKHVVERRIRDFQRGRR